MHELTDLEAAALGDIMEHQPCTAHFIRTSFRDSPAKHFSDSAGSVYPMMKRMEKLALISSKVQREGQRDVSYYRATAKGREALRRWVGPPIDESAMLTVDPLRTRMLYVGFLSRAKRTSWFKSVETELIAQLELVEEFHDQALASVGDKNQIFMSIAHENAVMGLHARLQWLKKAKDRLVKAGLMDE